MKDWFNTLTHSATDIKESQNADIININQTDPEETVVPIDTAAEQPTSPDYEQRENLEMLTP